jgi:integrase
VAYESTGTLRRTATGYFAQFSIGPKKRKGATLTGVGLDEKAAEARKTAIAALVARLREAGHTSVIVNTIQKGAKASADDFRKLQQLVARIVAGKEPGLAGAPRVRREGTTVAVLAEDWTTGKLAEQYPDHVRVKRSSAADARMLGWLGKVRLEDGTPFGDRAVATVTLDHCDHVMGALPKSAESPASRRQYAQALRRLLQYAVYPLRILPANPIPKGWLPRVSNDKAKAWLRPDEDLKLMQRRETPIVRRLLFGLLIREGLRLNEALSLTWTDVDLERGVLNLDTNKTDDPRSWAMGQDVAAALAAWRKLRGKKAEKAPRIFPQALIGKRWPLARLLRDDLEAAGVYRYKRAARTAAELGLGWLAPLDRAIPELAGLGPKGGRQGANRVQTGGPSGRRAQGTRSKTPRKWHLATGLTPPGPAWKSCVPARVPRVRIPLSPPSWLRPSAGRPGAADRTGRARTPR